MSPPSSNDFSVEAINSHTDHAGPRLGLGIVKSITQAHDGSLFTPALAARTLCYGANNPRVSDLHERPQSLFRGTDRPNAQGSAMPASRRLSSDSGLGDWGSRTVTQSPPAARGVRVRVPSCAWVMLLTIARPRPTPAWSVCIRSVPRWNGSTRVATSWA